MLKNTLSVFVFLFLFVVASRSQSIDIHGPEGSERFGAFSLALPNGNIVIADPGFDAGKDLPDAGAVYMYNGTTRQLISTMVGSKAGDKIGSGGLVRLLINDFLVLSPDWDGETAADVSAITVCSHSTGCPAAVTAENSLTGGTTGDDLGNSGIYVLSNGNYVISSRSWDNGAITDTGAVTFCTYEAGCPLSVSPENSLVGSQTNDMQVENVVLLANGNYVVKNPDWDNGAEADAGAVTLGNYEIGVSGVISAANSLVGTHMGDKVASGGIHTMPNGNYAVASPEFDNGSISNAGAVSFCTGSVAVVGPVLSFNSLIGLVSGDSVGSGGVKVLDSGNYVVGSPLWHNGDQVSAGAATWGSMNTGVIGNITESNSIIGTAAFNQVGGKIVDLASGNYVVVSQYSAIGKETMRGAITLGNGYLGRTGVVSAANSLIGKANDRLGDGGVFPLTNGNYVVVSPNWRNGKTLNAGAVTLGNGIIGITGSVTPQNSLVGSTTGDKVGDYGVVALSNGNYIVRSTFWNNAGVEGAGAVTWGNGHIGASGPVSAANSLVGTTQGDRAGLTAAALHNGNYVAGSPTWNGNAGAVAWGNGNTRITGAITTANALTGPAPGHQLSAGCGITPLINGNYVVCTPGFNGEVGAVTWGGGTTGINGTVSQANSLTGVLSGDGVGSYMVSPLSNGNYIVRSPSFGASDSGAITRGNGSVGTRGPLDGTNSVLGIATNGGIEMQYENDIGNGQIIVRRPADNIVTLYRTAAAMGAILGRVTDANGTPIRNAIVTLTGPWGEQYAGQTGQFGYYQIEAIPAGRLYNVSIAAKRYRFNLASQLFVDGQISDFNFTARAQESFRMESR